MFLAPQLVDLANQQSALSQSPLSPLAAYFSTMGAMSGTMAPARGAARASAEAVGYMSRRTLATIDSASRIGRCRTPKDFADEQTRFWNIAMQQYVEASARMMAAWGQAATRPVDSAIEPVTPATDRRAKTHDVIKLPEAKANQRNQRPPVADTDREAA